jgi:hypothetical protein
VRVRPVGRYFFPVTMAYEGYIDVIEKKSLEHKHRVFVDSLIGKSSTSSCTAIPRPT